MSDLCSIKECADAVRQAIADNKDNLEGLRTGLLEAARPFISRPDLFALGTKRPALSLIHI